MVIPANYRKIRSQRIAFEENQTWENHLINALMNRKALALYFYGQPGRHRININFTMSMTNCI
ncbi:MAG: hypothetical protein ACLUD0_05905 [Eubacterium ramulus]